MDPNVELAESYRELVAEFMEDGGPIHPFPIKFPHDDFPKMLAQLAEYARGEGLSDGFVPHSTFWLVRNGDTVVGVSNLRHILNDKLREEGGHIGYGVRPSARRKGYGKELLRQTLHRATGLGLERVLVTCDVSNIGSVRIIEANGGILDAVGYVESKDKVVRRYWISTAPSG